MKESYDESKQVEELAIKEIEAAGLSAAKAEDIIRGARDNIEGWNRIITKLWSPHHGLDKNAADLIVKVIGTCEKCIAREEEVIHECESILEQLRSIRARVGTVALEHVELDNDVAIQ